MSESAHAPCSVARAPPSLLPLMGALSVEGQQRSGPGPSHPTVAEHSNHRWSIGLPRRRGASLDPRAERGWLNGGWTFLDEVEIVGRSNRRAVISMLKRICVFCGSSPGRRPEYLAAAAALGRTLARRQLTLVYGGSGVGTMRALASAALDAGGQVIGVMTRQLVSEGVASGRLADLRVVGSMHERKAMMVELSDAFIALPGGFGTLDELADALSLAQLRLHEKPCGLLNLCGYYDALIGFLDHALEEGFIEPEHRAMVVVDDEPERMLDRFGSYRAPAVNKAERARAHA